MKLIVNTGGWNIRKNMANQPLLPYSHALELIAHAVQPLEVVRISWREVLGLTLAEDVRAQEPYPPFDNSAVDGYAVHAEDIQAASLDLPIALPVLEAVYAGKDVPQHDLPRGHTTQVMTGAPVPQGADAVVMVEDTQRQDDRVLIHRAVPSGANIRRKAEEMKAGEMLLNHSQPIGSAEWGLLAQQGILEVAVRRNPTVAVIATGDELVDPEESPTGGQLRNTNGYTLYAELKRHGCPVIDLGIGRDDRQQLRALIQRGTAEADVLLTSGGVSAGEKDYLPGLLAEMGMERIFHKVAVKPGKPLLFGKIGRCLVFGLPGNVVSVLSSFHLFVKPALRLLAGRTEWKNPVWYARMGQAMRNPGGRTNFVRCRLSHSPTGLPIAFPTGQQGSGMLTSMRGADGFAVIPADLEEIGEFDEVEFMPLYC